MRLFLTLFTVSGPKRSDHFAKLYIQATLPNIHFSLNKFVISASQGEGLRLLILFPVNLIIRVCSQIKTMPKDLLIDWHSRRFHLCPYSTGFVHSYIKYSWPFAPLFCGPFLSLEHIDPPHSAAQHHREHHGHQLTQKHR